MTTEQKILNVFNQVKKLEKQYNSPGNRTIKDIRGYYTDEYILSIWEDEKYNEKTDEGWTEFEDFLISLIEQNIQIESRKWKIE